MFQLQGKEDSESLPDTIAQRLVNLALEKWESKNIKADNTKVLVCEIEVNNDKELCNEPKRQKLQ